MGAASACSDLEVTDEKSKDREWLEGLVRGDAGVRERHGVSDGKGLSMWRGG